MNKLVLLSLLSTLIFAQYPRVYSVLGDVIYESADAIEKLKEFDEFSSQEENINKYIEEVNKIKKIGYAIEAGDNSVDKYKYLAKLRELSKINDSFKRAIKNNFSNSIKNENSILFLELVNSKLIDAEDHKNEIISYYYQHQDDINASGIIEDFVNEDIQLKKASKARSSNIVKSKIQRIREKDKLEQEKINRLLEEEVTREKLEIRKNQKKELLGN